MSIKDLVSPALLVALELAARDGYAYVEISSGGARAIARDTTISDHRPLDRVFELWQEGTEVVTEIEEHDLWELFLIREPDAWAATVKLSESIELGYFDCASGVRVYIQEVNNREIK